jgi:hypothetical protein
VWVSFSAGGWREGEDCGREFGGVGSKQKKEDGGNGEEEEDGDRESVTVCGEEVEEREIPTVCVKSIRRNGREMANFRNGMWGIQEAMGDMRYWKTWNPPQMADAS